MEKIFEKIDSYNIFNYLIPGSLFVLVSKILGVASLDSDDLLTRLITFYIVGLTLSRIGSLLFEPLLKSAKIVVYANYADFVYASSNDSKINALVEVSNMYRTMAVTFLTLFVATLVRSSILRDTSIEAQSIRTCLIALSILFFVSFAKQAGFVRKRVEVQVGGRACP